MPVQGALPTTSIHKKARTLAATEEKYPTLEKETEAERTRRRVNKRVAYVLPQRGITPKS